MGICIKCQQNWDKLQCLFAQHQQATIEPVNLNVVYQKAAQDIDPFQNIDPSIRQHFNSGML